MLNFLILLFLLAVTAHLITYAHWAWKNKYRRGAVGVVILAMLSLVMPVAVWIYHNYARQ